jgi:hypothetical protein
MQSSPLLAGVVHVQHISHSSINDMRYFTHVKWWDRLQRICLKFFFILADISILLNYMLISAPMSNVTAHLFVSNIVGASAEIPQHCQVCLAIFRVNSLRLIVEISRPMFNWVFWQPFTHRTNDGKSHILQVIPLTVWIWNIGCAFKFNVYYLQLCYMPWLLHSSDCLWECMQGEGILKGGECRS